MEVNEKEADSFLKTKYAIALFTPKEKRDTDKSENIELNTRYFKGKNVMSCNYVVTMERSLIQMKRKVMKLIEKSVMGNSENNEDAVGRLIC